jgi:hypothetical protein
MISYPESDGHIAESLMVISSFDWHTHNISGLCSFNKVDKSACLLSEKRLYIGSFYRTPSKDDPEIINQLHESVSKLTDIPFLILIDIPIWFLLTLDRQIYLICNGIVIAHTWATK